MKLGEKSPAIWQIYLERSATSSSETSSKPSPRALPKNPVVWFFTSSANFPATFFPKFIPFQIYFLRAVYFAAGLAIASAPVPTRLSATAFDSFLTAFLNAILASFLSSSKKSSPRPRYLSTANIPNVLPKATAAASLLEAPWSNMD